jgi:acylphosphatase
MSDDLVRRHVTVRGRVQGVFFRDSARETAEAQGVTGWVTNRSDGTVEAVLEGPRDQVETVIAFLRSGPPRADVADVDVREEDPEGFSRFEVR